MNRVCIPAFKIYPRAQPPLSASAAAPWSRSPSSLTAFIAVASSWTFLLLALPLPLPKVYSQQEVEGFPGGSVVKNLPANAGDTGSVPGPGRSHMQQSNSAQAPWLLGLCSRAWELQLWQPACPRVPAPQQEKPCNEKSIHRNWRVAPACRNPRKASVATKTQHDQK